MSCAPLSVHIHLHSSAEDRLVQLVQFKVEGQLYYNSLTSFQTRCHGAHVVVVAPWNGVSPALSILLSPYLHFTETVDLVNSSPTQSVPSSSIFLGTQVSSPLKPKKTWCDDNIYRLYRKAGGDPLRPLSYSFNISFSREFHMKHKCIGLGIKKVIFCFYYQLRTPFKEKC